jgi:glutathione synthase/RimK-type ligase-like ATP-grasp enzyme
VGDPAHLKRIALLHLGRLHDETPALRACLARRGIASEPVPLPPLAAGELAADGQAAADSPDWRRFDLVSVRDCRGSHRHGDFLPRIRALAQHLEALGVPLANPLPVIEAGHAKNAYLPRLAREGVALIPSRWLSRGWVGSLSELLDEGGWQEAVLKPAVGSLGWHTYRVRRDGAHLAITAADGSVAAAAGAVDGWLAGLTRLGEVCLQPFLPAVCREGEFSAVMLGGRFSHAVAKTVAAGGWIAHERFGGTNTLRQASAAERRWATAIEGRLRRRFGVLPYARIDGIRDRAGDLLLLECELVIPRLFLAEGEAFDRYAEVLLGPASTRMAW